jgi:hypothetical protein
VIEGRGYRFSRRTESRHLRKGIAGLFNGHGTLPLSIKDVPGSDQKVTEAQALIFQKLARAYTEKGALRVSFENDAPQANGHKPDNAGVGRL